MQRKQRYARFGLSLFMLCGLFHSTVLASTLKGELTFSGKTPEAGLIYFSEDKDPAPKKAPFMNQKDKAFSEKLVVSSKGSQVVFKNSDFLGHNIYADDSDANVKFDVGLMSPGVEATQKVDWDDAVVKCSCKIHPGMKAWIASIASRYYKVLNFQPEAKSLTFEIASVPSQYSKVKVWFPNYPTQEFQIKRGESKQIDLERAGKSFGALTLTLAD